MRVLLLGIVILLALGTLSAVDILLEEDFIRISASSFSFDPLSQLFYYKGKYISYGRLDSFSSYSSLFNPYRKYHYTGLTVSNSRTRGLRGFLFRFDPVSVAISFEDAYSAAVNYDGKYIDATIIYYSDAEWAERAVIHNYKRSEKKDVLSLIMRGRYKSYVDLMAILSYSPHIGAEGFYRISSTYKGLTLTLKYGNTFLSDDDTFFSVEAGLTSRFLDFSYSLSYDEESLYTDFFRSYDSSYITTVKVRDLRIRHVTSFSFSKSAEEERTDRFSISFKGIYLSYSTSGKLYFRIRRIPIVIGVDENGAFFSYSITDNIEVGYENGRFAMKIMISL